jgi:heme exporter protein C
MKLAWWKLLAIPMMLYVILAGTLIPLKPGIYTYSPTRITAYEDEKIKIQGYNTHFEAGETKVWVKLLNDRMVPAHRVNVINETNLEASFKFTTDFVREDPAFADATLIVDTPSDGYSIAPNLRLKASEVKNRFGVFMDTYPLTRLTQVDDFKLPFRQILHETIRNTFFHVAIWMAMFLLLLVSCYHSIQYLRKGDLAADRTSASLTSVGLFFGIAGLLTGSMWAKFTWGTFWTNDIKLNMSAIAMLIYFAYWLLRNSISDIDSRARTSSVYNLFAFTSLMILVMVIPRFSDSLHPGNGGNPAFAGEDLDSTLRAVFYPAIIAYTLLGFWMAQLYRRYLDLLYNHND